MVHLETSSVALYIQLYLDMDLDIMIRFQQPLIMKLKWLTPEFIKYWGWSGGAMVLGKLPVPGRPTILITVGQGSIALAVGTGGDGLDIFTLICPFTSFSLCLGDGPM